MEIFDKIMTTCDGDRIGRNKLGNELVGSCYIEMADAFSVWRNLNKDRIRIYCHTWKNGTFKLPSFQVTKDNMIVGVNEYDCYTIKA